MEQYERLMRHRNALNWTERRMIMHHIKDIRRALSEVERKVSSDAFEAYDEARRAEEDVEMMCRLIGGALGRAAREYPLITI